MARGRRCIQCDKPITGTLSQFCSGKCKIRMYRTRKQKAEKPMNFKKMMLLRGPDFEKESNLILAGGHFYKDTRGNVHSQVKAQIQGNLVYSH